MEDSVESALQLTQNGREGTWSVTRHTFLGGLILQKPSNHFEVLIANIDRGEQ